MTDNRFGTYIKIVRTELDLPLRKAASSIGISHSHLYNLECGVDAHSKKVVKPSLDAIQLISKAYNIDKYKLLYLAGYIENINEIQIAQDEINDISFLVERFLHEISGKKELYLDGEKLSDGDIKFLTAVFKASIDSTRNYKRTINNISSIN